jgi:hypothetical protein
LFLKNYLIIRNAWFKLEEKADHTYFVISVDKDKTPTITSYNIYTNAEAIYFKIFSSQSESNVVLTHLDSVDFRKLCIAYSNYLLIKHSFLSDWRKIMLKQIEMDYTQKRRQKANDIVDYLRNTITEEEKHVEVEIAAITAIMENRNEEHALSDDSKLDEWLLELEERVDGSRRLKAEIDQLLEENGKSLLAQLFA